MMVNFCDAVDMTCGGTPSTSVPEYWDGDIPWLSVGDLTAGNKYIDDSQKHITRSGFEHSSTKKLDAGDVVLSAKGTLGAMAMLSRPMCISQCCFGLRGRSDIVDQHYLYYYLRYRMPDIIQNAQRASCPSLKRSILRQIELDLPALGYQKEVAQLLSDIDDAIANNTAICADLEATAELIFDRWFVQFDFPAGTGKPYKSGGGKMVRNVMLRTDIPKGFKYIPIRDVCTVVDSLHTPKPECKYVNESTYLLTPDNITKDGYIDIAEKYYVSCDDYYHWGQKVIAAENDFVFINAGRAGDFAKLPSGVECPVGRNMTLIRPNLIDPYYLRQFFRSRYFDAQWRSGVATGSFFATLNVSTIKNMYVLLPDMAILRRYADTVKPMILRIEALREDNHRLASLRDYLLPLLMGGQVSIRR